MGHFAGADSLIAPLDMARFGLAYVALILLPGYALAALARPHSPRTERLALAVPCAASLVAISGLCTALFRLPFGLPAYAVLALPITGAAGYLLWRRRGASRDAERGCWWLMPAGVALVQLCAIALGVAPLIVPPGGDVVSHVEWTDAIARQHAFPIALLSAHLNSGDGGFYPPVFHALTALVLGVAPMATYRAVFYSVIAAVALLPLALFSYVRAVTGSARLGGFAALAALAFEPLPFVTLRTSYYPFILSMLYVPALALALRDALGHGRRRSVALSGALGIGLFYTHPTEFVTAALLTLGLVPGLLRGARAWARAGGYGVAIAAVWLGAALPALQAVRRTMVSGAQVEIHASHYFSSAPQVHLSTALDAYMYAVWTSNFSYLLPLAAVIGVLWCLVRHRWLGLVAIQAILAAVFVDANSYNLLQRFYQLSFPWALSDRLAATHYWVALPLAGIGIDVVARAAGRLVGAKSFLFRAMVAAPVVLFGLCLPLGIAAGQAARFATWGDDVAPADLRSIAWLARHAPPDSMVANDGQLRGGATFEPPIDAGQWMLALGGPRTFFGRGGLAADQYPDAVYLLRHIADESLPPRAVRLIEHYDVRYVFYGAVVRPGPRRHLRLSQLLVAPHLRLAFTTAATCRSGHPDTSTACPPTGSYVFAVTTSLR